MEETLVVKGIGGGKRKSDFPLSKVSPRGYLWISRDPPPSQDPQGAALYRLSSSHHTLSLSEDWNFPEKERVEKIPNAKKWLKESWFLDSISPFFSKIEIF